MRVDAAPATCPSPVSSLPSLRKVAAAPAAHLSQPQTDMSSKGDDKRVRTLTEKGKEQYMTNRDSYLATYKPARDNLDLCLEKCDAVSAATEALALHKELETSIATFSAEARKLKDFLVRENNQCSVEDLNHHCPLIDLRMSKCNDALAHLASLAEQRSVHSSGRSRVSQTSSAAARKRAKAEAAKARVAFARKELELKKQQALLIEQKRVDAAKLERQEKDIAAEIAVLAEEKEAAAADAEAAALEEMEDGASRSGRNPLPLPVEDSKARTAAFIAQQTNLSPHAVPFKAGSKGIALKRTGEHDDRELLIQGHGEPTPWTESLSMMLLRKELLLSRLSTFDEEPGNFHAWKNSFRSVTTELKASPREELDLLTKHLGKESARYAQSLRASNSSNPARGLDLLWDRLEERYGAPEVVESHLKAKVDSFQIVTAKEPRKLYDLCDLLDEVESAKNDPKLAPLFAVYDSSTGVNAIIGKLPHHLRQKWVTRASKYKEENEVPFPPFSFLVSFLRKESKLANDPAFQYQDRVKPPPKGPPGANVFNRATGVREEGEETATRCPIHKANHSLTVCKAFLGRSHQEKVNFLKEKKLCFKCLESTSHVARNCTAQVKCEKCKGKHHAVMHQEFKPAQSDGGEPPQDAVEVKCTKLCGGVKASRSCGKIVPVTVFKEGGESVRVYAVIDDQSNRSLASPALLDELHTSNEHFMFTLTSCSGTKAMSGRRAENLHVRSSDGKLTTKLPPLIECGNIPDERSEIPTPDVAASHQHLRGVASSIPQLENGTPIGLVIGRDLPDAHHVLQQVVGPPGAPFAQRLPLGWVIVGDVCLDGRHRPSTVNVAKTSIADNGRATIFEPCHNSLKVVETDIFHRSPDDERIGTSVEDREFLKLMDEKFRKNEEGRWTAPLPLKTTSGQVPNNRAQALGRARGLHAALKKDPIKQGHMIDFMSKILESGAAERAPPLEADERCWYLPFFGVYHPRKPDKIRGVFDSSATYEGVSLNSMLLAGPDLTNSLIGILMRFRRDKNAITADIEQMFYQFYVDEGCRDLLRFLWHEDNDCSKPLTEYRMRVHVFGNSPSPAVATYGLRKTVEGSDEEVKEFVNNNFYVDDGVVSAPDASQTVDLIRRTKADLNKNGGLKLNKMASSNREVLRALDGQDLSQDLKSVDLTDPRSPLPVHSCLGLLWDLNTDRFLLNPTLNDSTFTRRGLLSTLNSIYDPLGFVAPITIAGKILLRGMCPDGKTWDEPLPESLRPVWLRWRNAVESLDRLDVPRMYLSTSLTQTTNVKLHVFCDASEQAVSAVAYVEAKPDDSPEIGFVMGKAKLAPVSGHTIPRLELCSAVLATELYQTTQEHLGVPLEDVTFHTDSKVVLGYINNESRRFHTYVSNRVSKIRGLSRPQQWKYVPTEFNPADAATRGNLDGLQEKAKLWLQGPREFLSKQPPHISTEENFPLVFPDTDKEIRAQVCKTDVASDGTPLSTRFERFSSWSALLRAFGLLRHVCKSFHSPSDSCKGWHMCTERRKVKDTKATESFVLSTVQRETYPEEVKCLQQGRQLPKSSTLLSLSPYLDKDGLLRVGGRLAKAGETLGTAAVHPVILPKKHHVSRLLVRHFHEKVKHQGRHFTEGALRTHGFWIIGAKRLVSTVIGNCTLCKRLRGCTAHQKMADLPTERVTPSAPFSHVGVDVFGPWTIVTRKTRGGAANSKRWAVIFTCMAIRAIHIEVVEEMSSSSFINALTRFTSLRGPVVEFYSDKGTNFVGTVNELDVKWNFNPPHASHMGGVWERMIRIIRGILDSMLLDARRKPLTHEVLCTLMAEVCAIVNGRPITPISHDVDSPILLTPSMLLTQKSGNSDASHIEVTLKDMYAAQWKHVQALSDIFWKHWKQDYLNTLQQRRKWKTKQRNVKRNDIVLVRDKQAHRGDWLLGIVTETFPSEDGLTRSVKVRIASQSGTTNEYVRPISELVLLECE